MENIWVLKYSKLLNQRKVWPSHYSQRKPLVSPIQYKDLLNKNLSYFWSFRYGYTISQVYIPLSNIKDLNVIQQITRNRALDSLQKFYRKIWVSFWLNIETSIFIEISKNVQREECNLSCKTVQGIIKRSATFNMWNPEMEFNWFLRSALI